MIETLLPPGVVCVEAFEDDPDAVLFPAEAATLGRSVEKRRREFTTGRVCAHRALRGLGVEPAPVLPGPRREPIWPAGVVGSITHCAGYRAAAVARCDEIMTIGIDAEPNEVVPSGVLDAVSLPEERAWVASLRRSHPETCWDRLLFSTKESIYKAWFPLARRWLGFEDANVAVDPENGTFTARLRVPGPVLADGELTGFTGRWLVAQGLVLTAIGLPAKVSVPISGGPSPAGGG
jgi:4'-phosphopantetheinyl transferase EntD